MNAFPVVDPIPLPAPVWLFKVLHILTLGLHFVAVQMLLGGLAVALVLNFFGRKKTPESSLRLAASSVLARQLPVVMTYVINLGVPPLLFTQVLYGRALYTSSVLIGLWWIGVVLLLMGCYWHIYRFSAKIESGKPGWPMALAAAGLAFVISKIYSTNMTLMLHPEVWNQMYAKSGIGAFFPPHDPTLLPRWLFMICGGLAAAGLWLVWLAGRSNLDLKLRYYLSGRGGLIAAAVLPIQIWMAFQVFESQPEAVRRGLMAQSLYTYAGLVWVFGATALIGIAVWARLKQPIASVSGWVAFTLGVIATLGMTLFRDGIRDMTLLQSGFNVWDRSVSNNWSVTGSFIIILVAGLVGMGWLISVVKRAKPIPEKVIS